jgi:hypothetical protein
MSVERSTAGPKKHKRNVTMTGDNYRIMSAADAAGAQGRFSLDQFGGTFAYRFGGFTMLNGVPYRLAGLGQFQIDAKTGELTGRQRSSLTALHGQGVTLKTGEFSIAGSISMQADGVGSATLTFTKTTDGSGVKGEFNLLAAGSADRIWLVSSGGVVLGSGEPADELVEGEAVRITAA